MTKRAFILALSGYLCTAGVVVVAINPKAIETPPPKVTVIRETKVVTVTKSVKVPVKDPDGRMSRDECANLAVGTTMHDMMAVFGWPVGDAGNDSYAGMLYYPIREEPNNRCVVDMFGGKVNTVSKEDNQ
jgi:hypothetical protein